MNIPLYDASFYRGEIARLELALQQGIDSTERACLSRHLEAAKAYLAEITGGPAVGFKW